MCIKKALLGVSVILTVVGMVALTGCGGDGNPGGGGGGGGGDNNPKLTGDVKWYTDNRVAESFTISTADELAGLAALVNDSAVSFEGKTISLAGDIDLSVKYGKNYNGGKGGLALTTQARPTANRPYPFTPYSILRPTLTAKSRPSPRIFFRIS